MHVFIAGGTGVLGRRLVPQLVARGHHVTATTTSEAKLGLLAQLGATGTVMDGLDAASVGRAVAAARPDAIVHQMTAIDAKPDMRRPDKWFATTIRLRTEGTDHLLAAAEAAGVRHVVAQSYAGWNGLRQGGWVKTEEDPLDPGYGRMRPGADALRHVEDAVVAAGGAALRYGWLYGPGATDDTVAALRKRQFPLVGSAAGRTSWVHLDDAASATVLTVEQQATGMFNIVDDEPAPVEELRPLLFSIAYRILGSVSEAEDAVQESWLRWDASATVADSPKAFLVAVVTRVSINVLRSARVRREEYVGPWFPEPLLEDPYREPERSAELADSLSTAALVLLERLSPLERAVFVLREVFGFDYGEVAAAVGRSEPACRQLAARARRHMAEGRPRFDADRAEREELAERFFDAFKEGQVERLTQLLAADVTMVSDAGGKGPRWGAGIISGAANVARLLTGLVAPFARVGGSVEQRSLNGQPGAIFRDRDGNVVNTLTLDVVDGQVQTIRVVLNPDKLGHVGPVADAWTVVRETLQARREPE